LLYFILCFIADFIFYIAPVDIGIAQYFAVFGVAGVIQNDGAYGTLNGALGSGTSVTLDSAFTVSGRAFTSDATTLQVAMDLTAAMADCSDRANQIEFDTSSGWLDLGGMTLTPGVYHGEVTNDIALNTGTTLTLDAGNDANAVWIFNLAGGVEFGGTVFLTNYPGSGVPVWWNVDGGAGKHIYISSGAAVIGTIMSTIEIAVNAVTTPPLGSLLTLGTIVFSGSSSATIQAKTFPNSYAGVIGE
jgi:hypothetical protein